MGGMAANTANVKRYIDFAAANHIGGVLVEGWNVGWEDWFGNWKENVFDFVTPYPDFDVKAITDYARSKGVALIMHNETSGSATNYERQIDTAIRFMRRWGYVAVKTGYVGRIIPRGEHHDGQWMDNHYIYVAAKMAENHIMIDEHEPMRPTGLQRTYPNWLACEAARGNEYNAFADGNAPDHETILPFTRLMGGPMDYTPGIFRVTGVFGCAWPAGAYDAGEAAGACMSRCIVRCRWPRICRRIMRRIWMPSSLSGMCRWIGMIRRYWRRSRGIILRLRGRERGRMDWYIGAITDERARVADIPLGFLDKGRRYKAIVYRDADNADWKTNPEAYTIETKTVDSGSRLTLKLAPGGGAAVSIVPL